MSESSTQCAARCHALSQTLHMPSIRGLSSQPHGPPQEHLPSSSLTTSTMAQLPPTCSTSPQVARLQASRPSSRADLRGAEEEVADVAAGLRPAAPRTSTSVPSTCGRDEASSSQGGGWGHWCGSMQQRAKVRSGSHTVRGGSHTGRSGSHTVRGGSHTVRGGSHTVRGGSHTVRSGSHTVRGGSHTVRGGSLPAWAQTASRPAPAVPPHRHTVTPRTATATQ